MYIRGDPDTLMNRHMELAKETGTFIFYGLRPTMVPGVAVTELHWENSMTFDVEKLQPFMERLLNGHLD